MGVREKIIRWTAYTGLAALAFTACREAGGTERKPSGMCREYSTDPGNYASRGEHLTRYRDGKLRSELHQFGAAAVTYNDERFLIELHRDHGLDADTAAFALVRGCMRGPVIYEIADYDEKLRQKVFDKLNVPVSFGVSHSPGEEPKVVNIRIR